MANSVDLVSLRQAFAARNWSACQTIISQLKIQITSFTGLPPLCELPNVQEQLIAREVYEHAALLSLLQGTDRAQSVQGFERNFCQLKPFYFDLGGSLPASPLMHPILGLNLLRLLVESRMSEFHTELELIPAADRQNPSIEFPLKLERSLMEGSYQKVMAAQLNGANVPVVAESFSFFMNVLRDTVREEIADCFDKAYSSLSIASMQEMLMFSSTDELWAYMNAKSRDSWVLTKDRARVSFNPRPASSTPIPSTFDVALSYAKELERIA
eukprot:gnl/Spiro4/3323_TR1618_c0_g1_i1.p1 gnl/Spiro4/3323_TR1618_c0_g1~~gnl/Spiro4/3323_TR1618_c0_g1_i1.p1  ORF type:complete len:270 (+),score=44.95 gnl/Spiro4/3323_TR1618_c0_g1_i1:70-879(+)